MLMLMLMVLMLVTVVVNMLIMLLRNSLVDGRMDLCVYVKRITKVGLLLD